MPRGACVVQVPGAVGRYSAGKRSEASPACGLFEFGSARDRSFFLLAVFYFFFLFWPWAGSSFSTVVSRARYFYLSFLTFPFSDCFLCHHRIFFRCDGAFMTCLRVFPCALMCLGHGPVPFSHSLQFFLHPRVSLLVFFLCFFSFQFLCVLPLPTFLHVRLRSSMRSLRSARCVFLFRRETPPRWKAVATVSSGTWDCFRSLGDHSLDAVSSSLINFSHLLTILCSRST